MLWWDKKFVHVYVCCIHVTDNKTGYVHELTTQMRKVDINSNYSVFV